MSSIIPNISRRKTLGLGSALVIGACSQQTSTSPTPAKAKKDLILDFKSNVWNRDAMARIHGNLDFSKEKYGWFDGKVIGVMPGRKNIELCGFEGFSVTRLIPNEDGSYRKLLREVGFYKDLRTGEVLETFDNPYTGETVKVVPIANDPFNFTICLLYTSPSPRDRQKSRMPSSA